MIKKENILKVITGILIFMTIAQMGIYSSKVQQVAALESHIKELEVGNSENKNKETEGILNEKQQYSEKLEIAKNDILESFKLIQGILQKYPYEQIYKISKEDKDILVNGLVKMKIVASNNSKLEEPKFADLDNFNKYNKIKDIYTSCGNFVDNFTAGIDHNNSEELNKATKEISLLTELIK